MAKENIRFFKIIPFSVVIALATVFYFLNNRDVYSSMLAVPIEGVPELTQKLFQKGEALYQKQCLACHGEKGKGDGKAAYLLNPRPRDFTSGEFRLVSTIDAGPTEEDLFKTITRGMPGSAMPSWTHLPENERWGLVYYVYYLMQYEKKMKNKKFRDEIAAGGLTWEKQKQIITKEIPPESIIQAPAEPPPAAEGIARGRQLYLTSCAGCHGQEGKGDGQQEMINTDGTPTRPRDLTRGLFKGYPTSKDLYFRMMAGLPGSPMPSYQYSLTQEEIWDIIHYVQSLSDPEKEKRALAPHHQIQAKKFDAGAGLDLESKVWETLTPVYISLTPLWWRDDRVEGVEVKAARNEKEMAVWLRWNDRSADDAVTAPQLFSDGAAIQFSEEKDPPFFAMGDGEYPVTIWNWKASWQAEQSEWPDIEKRYPNAAVDWYPDDQNYNFQGAPFEISHSKTEDHDRLYLTGQEAGNIFSDVNRQVAAEEAKAKGFGSLTTMHPMFDKVAANGVWRDGAWTVVFKRNLKPGEEGRIRFAHGSFNIAFAVWDGAHRDRNGQKMVSIWNELIVEK